jgi:dihydroorotate dehydrogenase
MDLYRALIRPAVFAMSAEKAHDMAMHSLALASRFPGVCRRLRGARLPDARLRTTVFGREFASPIGLAAGLDKEAVGIEALAACGFSHIEVGTITGRAQPGNPKPRLFRLKGDEAFNNSGGAAVAAALARTYDPVGGVRRPPAILGINLGKSKVVDNAEALADYRVSVNALAGLADYLVVNVSSPNTPGLRDLQSEAALRPLLTGIRAAVDAVAPGRPLLLKIAPDLSEAGIDAAVDVALEAGCNGLIATNTTITRDGLSHPADQVAAIGAGGLSGKVLRARATAVLARVARRTAGRVPVIGVGGVDSADAAWEKLVHGASLVQLYSAMIYHGPDLVTRIHAGLLERFERSGAKSLAEVVGSAL